MNKARLILKRGTRYTLAIVLVIAIGSPTLFFLFAYDHELAHLNAELEVTASIINNQIRLNPLYWQYDLETFYKLLQNRKSDKLHDSSYILLPNGRRIEERHLELPRPTIKREQQLTDADQVVAHIVFEHSLFPQLRMTGIVFLLFSVICAFLFLLIRQLQFRILHRAEEKLQIANNFLKTIMEGSTNAIFVVDLDGKIVMVNYQGIVVSGYSYYELANIPFSRLFSEEEYSRLEQLSNATITSNITLDLIDAQLCRSDGGLVRVVCGVAPLRQHDEIINLVWTVNDVTAQKAVEEKVHNLIHFDALTQLPNRTQLLEKLAQSLSRAQVDRQQIAVVFLNLDHFKNINDYLGHDTGDLVLKEVAHRLVRCLRESDTVARYGGDEFVIILSLPLNDQETHITRVTKRILRDFKIPIQLQTRELHISCSIGIAIFPDDGNDSQTLLKHADLAMYHAKELGRNTFQFFSMALNKKICERMELAAFLNEALENGQFFLQYQPKFDLKSQRISGIEALIRWHHPALGLISPIRFIPVTEETGQIVPLGYWILRSACMQHRAMSYMGLNPPTLAVNISIRQLQQPDFVSQLSAILQESGVPPHQLELELTESCLMESSDSVLNKLNEIKQIGVKIAIDDFGTGYSSLGYLKHFPVDRLKIDRCFVNDIDTTASDNTITQAIIVMAKSLGLKVTAEGVESEEQLRILRQHNCDEIQGYLYSRPLSTEDLEDFLKNEQQRQGRLKI